MSKKLIYRYNIESYLPQNKAGYLCFLMYPGVVKSMAWITITFSLSTAASTDVSLLSIDQS
jgi:hypothetical protein